MPKGVTKTTRRIVAKLVANATTYGRVSGHSFQLALYVVGDTLRIEVTDTRGDRLPPGVESGCCWRILPGAR